MNRTFHPQPGRSWRSRLLWLLPLAAILGGWWWLMERAISNDRAALQVEREQRFQNALETVSENLARHRADCLNALQSRADFSQLVILLETNKLSGALLPEPIYEKSSSQPVTWKTLEPLLGSGDIPWSSDEDGRDETVSLLVAHLDRPGVRELLRQRALGETGPPLRPSFRHWLLENLRMVEDDSLLAKVSAMEAARATGEAPSGAFVALQEGTPAIWWTSEFMEDQFQKIGTPVTIGKEGKTLPGWEFPQRFQPAPAGKHDFSNSARLLRIVGISTAALTTLLVAGLLISAGREIKLARLRTDLAAAVAHELRTPVAGQRVLLESLRNGLPETDEERADYLRMALRENIRLGHLAEHFLTFSRLERGVMELSPADTKIAEILTPIIEAHRGDFETIECEITPADLTARLDRDAFESIATNLIENAVKYAKEGGFLRVAVHMKNLLVLEVSDRGPGLSAKEQALVFRQFWRGDQSLQRRTDGLGLGLSIVKRLAEAHGGEVTLTSERGHGCHFRVTLDTTP